MLSSITSLEAPTIIRRVNTAYSNNTEHMENSPLGSLVFFSKKFTRGFTKSAIIHANIKGKIYTKNLVMKRYKSRTMLSTNRVLKKYTVYFWYCCTGYPPCIYFFS